MLLPLLAFAEITPASTPYDARIRTAVYNAHDVVRIVTWYGISTHIRFADDETVEAVAIGDADAWEVVPRANHLFVKPKAAKASTNITVLTDKRVYQLALVVQKPQKKEVSAANLVFSLAFTYPEEEAKRQQKADQARLLARHLKEMDEPPARNCDYWAKGSDAVIPERAFDDERFVYLVFAPGADMPAVYEVDENQDEALINTHVRGNTVVVHRLARRLMLRKGKSVALIENRSFDPRQSLGAPTGTVSGDVFRIIREDRK